MTRIGARRILSGEFAACAARQNHKAANCDIAKGRIASPDMLMIGAPSSAANKRPRHRISVVFIDTAFYQRAPVANTQPTAP
jgi:hypothetical protein